MTIALKNSHARTAAWLVLATLSVRALVPLGYMPGKLLQGELVELCPVASAATVAMLNVSGMHNHEHGDATEDTPSIGLACPIGSSLFFDAIPALDVPIAQLRRVHEQPAARLVAGHIPRTGQPHPARGPPHS